MDKKLLEFSVQVYGDLEAYNEVLSKARCRIFYKYGNRNGTYITDEFADSLVASLPYAPVKGIYDYEDYSDHGTRRSEGRIYGIVPQDPNLAWETHVDEDGVERTYACADVLIFTALYKEAAEIVGKSQSMELYEPSLSYHQAVIEGQKWIVFDKGCFLGLQVLGDDVEPCFEGASFYTLQNSIEDVINKITQISNTYSKEGGKSEMNLPNFKLSDDQKYSALWSLLNEEYTEENNWTVTYSIAAVYDEYALACNIMSGEMERVFYKKNDETDSLEITNREVVYIVDVTEAEKNTLDTLRKLNGDTYEVVKDNLTNAEENFTKLEEMNSKIEEYENVNTTLSTEKSEIENLYNETKTANEGLEAKVNELEEFKHNVEVKEKEAVLNQYSEQLSDEVLDSYREKFDTYTVVELDKELTYELKKANPAVFAHDDNNAAGLLPKDGGATGIEAILARYAK